MAKIAEAEIEELSDGGGLCRAGAGGEHLAGGVDADDRDPGPGDRDRDSAGADPELDDRPARLARLRDVEADVLDDASAPGVVELRDRVVGAWPELTKSAQIRHNGVQFRGLGWGRRHVDPHPGGWIGFFGG